MATQSRRRRLRTRSAISPCRRGIRQTTPAFVEQRARVLHRSARSPWTRTGRPPARNRPPTALLHPWKAAVTLPLSRSMRFDTPVAVPRAHFRAAASAWQRKRPHRRPGFPVRCVPIARTRRPRLIYVCAAISTSSGGIGTPAKGVRLRKGNRCRVPLPPVVRLSSDGRSKRAPGLLLCQEAGVSPA
jgi:hypothetical protein